MGGKRINKEIFIELAVKKHGNFYDYNDSIYVNKELKIKIKCPIHGYFHQTPEKHLIGQGCPKCRYIKSGNGNRKNKDEFIENAKEIHGDKYTYEKVEYINNNRKVIITCNIHGDFKISPINFTHGRQGCSICGREKSDKNRTYSTDEFIEKANKVHNYRYDYSKTKYGNSNDKVIIICPKHGEFKQTPANHLFGQGCNKCRSSQLERKMRNALINAKLDYIEQYKEKWLGRMSLDFLIPSKNIAIECQGKQHFNVGGWSKEGELKKIKNRDIIKKKLCFEKDIDIIYYSELDIRYPYQVYENVEDIIKFINNIK